MSLRNKNLSVYRFANSSLNSSGLSIPGAESLLAVIKCSLQPLNGEEIKLIDSGRRELTSYKVYTNTDLRASNTDAIPDQVEYLSKRYEIFHKFDWNNQIINHYKYIILELKDK